MGTLFACLFAVGIACLGLFTYDLIQGRLTRYTTWKELTGEQWFFFIGSFLIPIGLVGLMVVSSAH